MLNKINFGNIKISIAQKHFVYFLFLYLISIIVVSSYSYYIARKSILNRTFNQLASVRTEKAKSIETFFKDRINEAKIIDDAYRNFEKHNASSNKNLSDYLLNQLKNIVSHNNYYKRLLILNDDGRKQILSKNDFDQDLDLNEIYNHFQNNFFKKKKFIDSIIIEDYRIKRNKEIVFYIIAPTVDSSKQNPVKQLLVFEINSESINAIMFKNNNSEGLGKSGEAYIVGNDYLLRTSSRFKLNSLFNLKVNTTATKEAFQNKINSKIIRDYRNIKVLSSYSPLNIQGLNWAIIAEIDYEEALLPIYDLRNSIVILCIVVSMFIFGLVYIGSKKITNPIILLKESALEISKGNFTSKLEYKERDELGELINSFNEMADKLKQQSEKIKNDELERINSMFEIQEQERQRLSRDLHDGLGQMILATKMKLEQAKNSGTEKSQALIIQSIELLKSTITEIRSISNDLMPAVLQNFGLEEALRKLCKDFSNDSNFQINFVCDLNENLILDSKKQIYLFRIIQEIFNNIQKHSQADQIGIEISNNDSKFYLKVKDNGIGFDLSTVKNGFGLININDRTQLLGGSINLQSIMGEGTQIEIQIPIVNGGESK